MEKEKINQKLNLLFNLLDHEQKGKIGRDYVLSILKKNGLDHDDHRLSELIKFLNESSENDFSYEQIAPQLAHSNSLLERAIHGQLCIPEFAIFSEKIEDIFEQVKNNTDGVVADYIPQLAKVDPEQFGVAICTIDGQQFSLGDNTTKFCVQSTCKPINYSIALDLHGTDKVHEHIGREPSGKSFNAIMLNRNKLPHNPMINAGAIMACALIRADLPLAERFESVNSIWTRLASNSSPGFDNTVYHSEKASADRNFALAHFMREMKCFPKNTNLHDTLDFYFQCCSFQLNVIQMSHVAATLANGGVSPITGEKIFSENHIRHCLSLMSSCGMYDFSGEFAFHIGLPAKSGISGILIVIIPNLIGFAIWSPRLDTYGNSVRGVNFCKSLVKNFNFHPLDSVLQNDNKFDPRFNNNYKLTDACSIGDFEEVKRLCLTGTNPNNTDYDKRTALHLACSEGHEKIARYLIEFCNVDLNVKDRWGFTPFDEAQRNKHKEIINLFKNR